MKAGDIDNMVLEAAQWSTQTSGDDFYEKNTKARNIEWVSFSFFWNTKSPFFEDVRVTKYQDELIVTEPEPLVDYVQSMNSLNLDQADLEALLEEASVRIKRSGPIRITKDSGLITATRRN